MKPKLALTAVLCSLTVAAEAAVPWPGYVDLSIQLQTANYPFGAGANGNKNYYDGDFADYDGDGLADRNLISRFGLLHNQGGGVMIPVSAQQLGESPNQSPSLTGFLFGDEVSIGNDAAQWADIDGDGDPDNIMGGNGEQWTVQTNREGRFTVRRKYSGVSALNIANTDVDGDGDGDLAVAHAFCSNRSCGGPVDFTLMINDGNGDFTDETAAWGVDFPGEFIVGVVSGDVDGDGDFDLLLFNGAREEVTVARNNGDGSGFSIGSARFARPKSQLEEIGSGFAQMMTLGDIDADGDLDLVLCLPENWGTGPLGPVGEHPNVSHAVFVNDGVGNFREDSLNRFDVGTFSGLLKGNNGKLVDVDFDGDLDLVAYDKPGPNHLQLYLNDGGGRFVYRPDLTTAFSFTDAGDLGADADVTDIDGDGTYDLWIGLANQNVHTLINGYQDPTGTRADLPRDVRIEAVAADRVQLSWQAPPWAAANRHYKVYRSVAAGMGSVDRELVKVVAVSPHEDDSFAAPISRFTTDLGDPDVTVDGRRDRVSFTDRTVVPGVRYHYSVAHVGTERTESRKTDEVAVDVPPPAPGPDVTAPALTILHPTDQTWSAYPRVVLTFADGQSGIDPASLAVSFDVPVGTLPPDTDLSGMFVRRDGNSLVLPLTEGMELPQGLARLSAQVADVDGNVATASVLFVVSVQSPQPPNAVALATPRAGTAVVDFDATGSSDPDLVLLRWEWYFGDGAMALGQTVSHRYASPGTWPVTLVVRDNEGGVGSASTTVDVASVVVDSDGDGVDDPADCAPLNPLAFAPPVGVTGLKAVKAGADVALSWDDQRPATGTGTVYDLVSGLLSELHRSGPGAAASCLEGNVTAPATTYSGIVPPADGAFFQARARNACGHGSWGFSEAMPACP